MRQSLQIQLRLVERRRFVFDERVAERARDPFTGKVISNNFRTTVFARELGVFRGDVGRIEGSGAPAYHVGDEAQLVLAAFGMADAQRKGIMPAGAGIGEGMIVQPVAVARRQLERTMKSIASSRTCSSNSEVRSLRNSASHSERAASGSASMARSILALRNMRVEGCRRAAHHEHVIVVLAEVLLVFVVQQAGFAVRRGDRDQHAIHAHQGRQHGTINLDVGRGRTVVTPKADFIENHGDQRSTANITEAVAVNGQGDAVGEPDLKLRVAGDQLAKDRRDELRKAKQ